MASLSGATIATTFKSLLKLAGNTDDLASGGSNAIQVMTGDGENTPLYLNTDRLGIGTVAPESLLHLAKAGTSTDTNGTELTNGAFLTIENTTTSNYAIDTLVGGIAFLQSDSGTDGSDICGRIDSVSQANGADYDMQFWVSDSGTPKKALTLQCSTYPNALFTGQVYAAGNVGIGGGPVAPDTTLHVWKGDAGSHTVHAQTTVLIEGASTANYVEFVNAANQEQGILFGDGGTARPGSITYNHLSDDMTITADDSIDFVADDSINFAAENMSLTKSQAATTYLSIANSNSSDGARSELIVSNNQDNVHFGMASSNDATLPNCGYIHSSKDFIIEVSSSGGYGVGIGNWGASAQNGSDGNPEYDPQATVHIKSTVATIDGNMPLLHLECTKSTMATDDTLFFLECTNDATVAADVNWMLFRDDNGEIGSLHGNSTQIDDAFTQGSDVRWKKNIVDTSLKGIETINQIKVRDFEWNAVKGKDVDGQKVIGGFIADELYEVYPAASRGTPGAVNEDGSIKGMGVMKGAFTQLLIKAVQELSAKVTALENA